MCGSDLQKIKTITISNIPDSTGTINPLNAANQFTLNQYYQINFVPKYVKIKEFSWVATNTANLPSIAAIYTTFQEGPLITFVPASANNTLLSDLKFPVLTNMEGSNFSFMLRGLSANLNLTTNATVFIAITLEFSS